MAITTISPEITKSVTDQPKLSVPHERIFGEHPEAVYYIGEVAAFGTIHDEELWGAIGHLRGNEYVHKRGFLPLECLDAQGREYDEYDDQSLHYAIVKSATDGNHKTAQVVAGIRGIVGESDATPLPLEAEFNLKINMPKSETSRFISNDRNKIPHIAAVALVRVVVDGLLNRGIPTTYFEIEAPVKRLLEGMGIPLIPVTEQKEVEEPGGIRTLYPLMTPLNEVPTSVVTDFCGVNLQEFFRSAEETSGLGYFPDSLMGE